MPLYPLAEWIVENWWFLLREPLTPARTTSTSYRERHNFIQAGEGFAVPLLLLQPHGKTVFLQWQSFRFPDSPIQFLSTGQAFADLGQVESELRGLVDSVVERLESEGVRASHLQEEWSAINALTAEEVEFCEAAARLGLDPLNLEARSVDEIIRLSQELPRELAEDFFSVAEPDRLTQDLQVVMRAIRESQETSFSSFLLQARAEVRAYDSEHVMPWVAGYEAARRVRSLLPAGAADARGINSLAVLFGIDIGNHHGKASRRSDWFDALTCVKDRQFAFYLPPGHERRIRFAFCRVVYEILTAHDAGWRLMTHGRTDFQARNRAFAAEFLVPTDDLKRMLPGTILDEEEVEELADEFNVSSWVVRHQLENHDLARIIV